MRTGASFVRHDVTGYLVERLPPGHQCVASDDDETSLASYLDALRRAQTLDRRDVRDQAATRFGTAGIVDSVLRALDGVRGVLRAAL